MWWMMKELKYDKVQSKFCHQSRPLYVLKLIAVIVTHLCEYSKNQLFVHTHWMTSIVCELYFNKAPSFKNQESSLCIDLLLSVWKGGE